MKNRDTKLQKILLKKVYSKSFIHKKAFHLIQMKGFLVFKVFGG